VSIVSRFIRLITASGVLASAFFVGAGLAPQAFGVAPASAQITTVTCPTGTRAHVFCSSDQTCSISCY
jgi:hypothetical protein